MMSAPRSCVHTGAPLTVELACTFRLCATAMAVPSGEGAMPQPVAGSQYAVTQGPAWVVQTRGACTQPFWPQASMVQMSPSSQLLGVPMHWPAWQIALSRQGLACAQEAPSGSGVSTQLPLEGSKALA